jgi:hypothetical protein
MAETRLTPQDLSDQGITPSYTTSLSDSDTYLVNNDGKVFLHFKKTGAGDCDVTIQTPATVHGLAVAERTVTVPATTGDKMIGPFPPSVFNDGQDVKFTLSEVTDLSVAVIRM